MTVLDRYLLHVVLRPLAATIGIALLALLTERTLRILETVLGANGPINIVFELLAFLLPHYLGIALPLGLFLGVLLGFRRLQRDSELDVLHSAGISLPRLALPIAGVTLAAGLVAAIMLSYMQPYGRFAYRVMVFDITNAAIHALLNEGEFLTVDGTTFLIEKVSANKQKFERIFLYRTEDDGTSTVITAEQAEIALTVGTGAPVLRMFNGVSANGYPSLEPDTATQRADPDGLPESAVAFRELRTPIAGRDGETLTPRGKDEREFTLPELWDKHESPPNGIDVDDMTAEMHNRLVRILSILPLPFLAIPLARSPRRSKYAPGLPVGVLILVLYNEALDFGKNLVESGDAGVLLGLWLPFLLFTVGSLLLFRYAATKVTRGNGILAWASIFASSHSKRTATDGPVSP
ncbi:LptF/LptG family permease [Oceanibacterium hippocampi]|uniref:Lipopolysaccharide export system permease protein LptF n=1 Tax=Oceanibacterium hippocampi TaxID=745714 RepID=A0A1Y5TXI6_9PROT|nr:LptF/LptG family permease [Oceanibacterium hippocampi]SLN76205.1 Lipopolysaccharide export system permease protein LptF [Oceanibacterium hippocampi]